MIVFDKLWDTMREKNISTYTLREKYGFHSRTIRRLRDNENITTDTLDTLCNVLDCEISDIVTHIKE